MLTSILLGIVIVFGVWLLFTYNGLITRKNRVDEAWADIDVQLKRRHDLIPNLVESVKGYASHEQETLTKVIEARNKAVSAQTGGNLEELAGAEMQLGTALRGLFALSENYPALRANENFLHLQQELTDTENKLQASRRFFNGQARDFNTSIQTFPTLLFAQSLGFAQRAFFSVEDEAERANPKVQF